MRTESALPNAVAAEFKNSTAITTQFGTNKISTRTSSYWRYDKQFRAERRDGRLWLSFILRWARGRLERRISPRARIPSYRPVQACGRKEAAFRASEKPGDYHHNETPILTKSHALECPQMPSMSSIACILLPLGRVVIFIYN